ncbi:MAG: hypothetical protein ACXVAN_07025 [Polyangia bacterium]
MKTMLTIFKLLGAVTAIALFFLRNHLFVEFSTAGTKTPDEAHRVLMNNHGYFSYITAQQNRDLRVLVMAAVTLFLSAVLIDVLQRRFGARQWPWR